MNTHYKVIKSGYFSGITLTHDSTGSNVFATLDEAKTHLMAYAEMMPNKKERNELKAGVRLIQEKHLEWDETHIDFN